MKKLINKPEDVCRKSWKALAMPIRTWSRCHYNPNFIVRADAPVKAK